MTIIVDSSDRTNYSELVGDVRRLVPMLIEPMVVPLVAEVAREFCKSSSCWRSRRMQLLTTQGGVQVYDCPDLPSDAELYRVNAAWKGQDEVPLLQAGQEDDSPDDMQSDRFKIGISGVSSILLSPAPITSGSLVTGGITLIPKLTAISLPTVLVDQYRLGIVHGVLAKMVIEADKPWGNPGMEPYHREKYSLFLAKASSDAGPIRSQPLRVSPY